MATLYYTPSGFLNRESGQYQEPESGDTVIVLETGTVSLDLSRLSLAAMPEEFVVRAECERYGEPLDVDDWAAKEECEERGRPTFPKPVDDPRRVNPVPRRQHPAADHRHSRPP